MKLSAILFSLATLCYSHQTLPSNLKQAAVKYIAEASSEKSQEGTKKRGCLLDLSPEFPRFKRPRNSFKEASREEVVYRAADFASYAFELYKKLQTKTEGFSPLRLETFLYCAQGYYLSFYDKPLFQEELVQSIYSPIVLEVYGHFKECHEINDETMAAFSAQSRKVDLSDQEMQILDGVFHLVFSAPLADLFEKNELGKVPLKRQAEKEQVLPKQRLKKEFRELNIWLPFVVQLLIRSRSHEDIEDLICYMRNYISYTCLSNEQLDLIVTLLMQHKNEIEDSLRKWASASLVTWPQQTTFQAFMGHLFFPIQYDILYENTSQLKLREPLQYMLARSAYFGNLLALYYLADVLAVYSSYGYGSKQPGDTLNCLKVSDKERILDLKKADQQATLPPLYGGILLLELGHVLDAEALFQLGANRNHPECMYRLAMSIKIPQGRVDLAERRSKVINQLMGIQEGLGHYAQALSQRAMEDRINENIKAGELGVTGGFHAAAVICEKRNMMSRAKELYTLSARNHLLSDYEKVAMLAKQEGNIEQMKEALLEWGQAGDSTGYVNLGEYILTTPPNKSFEEAMAYEEAMTYFQKAGLPGLECMIKHARTDTERKQRQILLLNYCLKMVSILSPKSENG